MNYRGTEDGRDLVYSYFSTFLKGSQWGQRMFPKRTSAAVHRKVALEENRRHFVFGDIHGRFTTFQRLLDLINYDTSTDVIYSVGDMIDRGPDSVPVVEFFQQPHCHAILGNHEQMILNASVWKAVWMDPWTGGPTTLASLEKHGYNVKWLARICADLPVCLDVGDDTQSTAFRLIHAESPLEWSEDTLLSYLTNVTRLEAAEGRLLWGRSDIERIIDSIATSGRSDDVPVSQHRSSRAVFCGHTPVNDVVNAFNVNWIDTAAGGTMTCMDPTNLYKFQVPIDEGDWY